MEDVHKGGRYWLQNIELLTEKCCIKNVLREIAALYLLYGLSEKSLWSGRSLEDTD